MCTLEAVATALPRGSDALRQYLANTYGTESDILRLSASWTWDEVGIVWSNELPDTLRSACLDMTRRRFPLNTSLWALPGMSYAPMGALWANEERTRSELPKCANTHHSRDSTHSPTEALSFIAATQFRTVRRALQCPPWQMGRSNARPDQHRRTRGFGCVDVPGGRLGLVVLDWTTARRRRYRGSRRHGPWRRDQLERI